MHDEKPYRVLDDVEASMVRSSHPCYSTIDDKNVHCWNRETGQCEDCGVEDDSEQCDHADTEYDNGRMFCRDCNDELPHLDRYDDPHIP
jgi:hypothetical protein